MRSVPVYEMGLYIFNNNNKNNNLTGYLVGYYKSKKRFKQISKKEF